MRIALATVGTTGDVVPFVALARGLSAAGHEVTVPSVVIPHVGDQPYWAMRLHRLAVAPAPLEIRAVTSDAARERVLQATAEPMRATAERLGRAVAAEDGAQAAIGLIEGAMRTPAA